MGKGSKQTTTSRQDYHLPEYMRSGSQDAVRRGRQIANRDYTAYGGQRISDLSRNEQTGVNMAFDNVGAWQGDFASARGALDRIQSMKDPGALKGYMNPYMEEVLNPAVRRRNRAFDAQRAERQSTRGMRSAFGGRGDLYDATLAAEHEEGIDDLYSSAYGQAFDRATSAFQQEQDRYLGQARAFQSIGEGAQAQRRGDLRDLMTTGLTERTRDQADLDFQYLEHLEKRDWDIGNLDVLVRTLQAVPHEYSTTGEQTTESKPSALKTISGIGALTAGAIMTGGASLKAGGSFWGGIGEALMGIGSGST